MLRADFYLMFHVNKIGRSRGSNADDNAWCLHGYGFNVPSLIWGALQFYLAIWKRRLIVFAIDDRYGYQLVIFQVLWKN